MKITLRDLLKRIINSDKCNFEQRIAFSAMYFNSFTKLDDEIEACKSYILLGYSREGENILKKYDTLDIKYVQRRIDSLKDFRYLKGYQIALEFYKKLYEVISELPFYEQYGVFDQLDRASMSIVANLAEGNENIYDLKKVNFYAIALATTNECQCWLDVMYIKQYITKEKHQELDSMLVEIKKLIVAYIKAINALKLA